MARRHGRNGKNANKNGGIIKNRFYKLEMRNIYV